jgi:hypothetical protein
VSTPADVEVSRALNALSTTLREQRPDRFDAARAQEIVSGALAGEPKLEARATGATSGELRIRDDGRLLANVELRDGRWAVERRSRGGQPGGALPRPALDEQTTAH